MRESKFKAKSVIDKKWVKGSGVYYEKEDDVWFLIVCNTSPMEIFTELVEVIPETIGEYTGLKDKNGIAIYEGDIIKQLISTIPIDNFCTHQVSFSNGIFKLGKKPLGWPSPSCLEVIGNITEKKDNNETKIKYCKTIRTYRTKFHGYDIIIPKGSICTNETALGPDDNYHFWINWEKQIEKLTGYKNSMLHYDLLYYGLNIPAKYCGEYE